MVSQGTGCIDCYACLELQEVASLVNVETEP